MSLNISQSVPFVQPTYFTFGGHMNQNGGTLKVDVTDNGNFVSSSYTLYVSCTPGNGLPCQFLSSLQVDSSTTQPPYNFIIPSGMGDTWGIALTCGNSRLIGACPLSVVADFTANASNPNPPGPNPPGPNPNSPSSSSSKTTYIIIGAVVGTAVLAVLVGLTIFLIRRRQRLRALQQRQAAYLNDGSTTVSEINKPLMPMAAAVEDGNTAYVAYRNTTPTSSSSNH